MRIRRARPEEADALAALAVRSKAYWPYPRDLIERFARTLGMTSDVVAANDVSVGERDGELRGFTTVLHRGALAVLDDLWLEPSEIGLGSGRLLFEHAARCAAAGGASTMEWDAEPYAVGFYERMGAARVGYADSPLGRRLPVMQMRLDGAGRRADSRARAAC